MTLLLLLEQKIKSKSHNAPVCFPNDGKAEILLDGDG